MKFIWGIVAVAVSKQEATGSKNGFFWGFVYSFWVYSSFHSTLTHYIESKPTCVWSWSWLLHAYRSIVFPLTRQGLKPVIYMCHTWDNTTTYFLSSSLVVTNDVTCITFINLNRISPMSHDQVIWFVNVFHSEKPAKDDTMTEEEGQEWLYELLTKVQLNQFYTKLRDDLQVTR